MPLNPSLKKETASDPVTRGNPLNDPQFSQDQGYNSYDLNNSQLCTPRFGEATPTAVFETVPGDRHVLHDASLTFLNQIDARVVSEINAYADYFYVPFRAVFPINYEKLIPNPTKGDDLPNAALPQIPLAYFIRRFMQLPQTVLLDDSIAPSGTPRQVDLGATSSSLFTGDLQRFQLNALIYIATMLSRGQLLDYLGYSLDDLQYKLASGTAAGYAPYRNEMQRFIDNFFDEMLNISETTLEADPDNPEDGKVFIQPRLRAYDLTSFDDGLATDDVDLTMPDLYYNPTVSYDTEQDAFVSDFRLDAARAFLYDALEKGYFIWYERVAYVRYAEAEDDEISEQAAPLTWASALWTYLWNYFNEFSELPDMTEPEPFTPGFINPLRLGAYQLSVAEYMSNDSVDNVFSADLYMQNLRGIMFPSVSNISRERTFKYNGVDTEYDLLTTGAWSLSFFDDENSTGLLHRCLPFISALFFLRRSLRYGDYFATGRPNMLAVGQLSIPVNDDAISPIDVTTELVYQRFLNASNRTGAKFENYMPAMYGVQPSDQGTKPRFIAHRKIELMRETVTNTANNQGAQTTNLQAASDSQGIDVFIDDFGCVIVLNTFDALPVYPSGIDPLFFTRDRFSMFNSMLQNVGDQPITTVELTGDIRAASSPEVPFAYTVRYAQYKYGHTRAHGAFVNSLPGFSMLYPWHALFDESSRIRINPDFIRDKPYYFDQFFSQRTGASPAQYYHFIVSVTNQHAAARKMQYQPPLLW